MPCANKRWFVSTQAESERLLSAKFLCNRCGAVLALSEVFHQMCEACTQATKAGNTTQPPRGQNSLWELGRFSPLAARRLLKLFGKAGIAFQTEPMLCRVHRKGGPVTETLVSIVITSNDLEKAKALLRPDRLPANAIRNCTMQLHYVCPLDWAQLEPTAQKETRFCVECQKNVFLCLTDFEAINHARQGHCIAMRGEDGSAKYLLKMGMPPPLTEEEKARYVAYRVDQAKTNALQQLTDNSSFCTGCGFPLPMDNPQCLVCTAKEMASAVS